MLRRLTSTDRHTPLVTKKALIIDQYVKVEIQTRELQECRTEGGRGVGFVFHDPLMKIRKMVKNTPQE